MPDEETSKKRRLEFLGNKELLNAAASALDPEAARLVDRILAGIPQGSWLRSAAADRILGIVKSLIESEAGKKGPITAVAGEKFTDYLDIGRTALSGRGSKEAKRNATEVDPVAWMRSFFVFAEKKLADSPNPEETRQWLEVQFQARKAIFDLIKETEDAVRAAEEAVAPAPPATEPIDWGTKWSSFKEEVHRRLWGGEGQINLLTEEEEGSGPLRRLGRAAESDRARQERVRVELKKRLEEERD